MKQEVLSYVRTPGRATAAGARTAPREVLHVLHIPGRILAAFGVKRWVERYSRDCPGHWRTDSGRQVPDRGQRMLFELRDAFEHDNDIPIIADRPPVRQEQLSGPGRRVMPSGPAYAPGELFECDCGRQHPAGWICNSAHRDQM